MCGGCVKQEYPDRGRMCLESGSYLANLRCCIGCNGKDQIESTGTVRIEDQEGKETITYKHVCRSCGHLVAEHEYQFWVDEEGAYQEYSMSCLLCGSAEDSISVLPNDPRKETDPDF